MLIPHIKSRIAILIFGGDERHKLMPLPNLHIAAICNYKLVKYIN